MDIDFYEFIISQFALLEKFANGNVTGDFIKLYFFRYLILIFSDFFNLFNPFNHTSNYRRSLR